MERIMAQPWDEITTDQLAGFEISGETRRRLGSAQLQISVSETGGALQQKEVQILIAWQNTAGRSAEPVMLTAWTFAPQR